MQSNDVPNEPLTTGGYVPYFYQAGLYLRYNQPGERPSNGPYARASAGYHSAVASLWNDRNEPQTVEDVISRGYFSVPRSDPIAAIITDKQHTARLGLDDAIGQIRNRFDLYQQSLQEIDESVCEARNAVHRQEADQGFPATNRQQYSAEKRVQDLYENKRLERLNLWRDVSRIRLGLPETIQQYLTAYRKVTAFESFPGDGL